MIIIKNSGWRNDLKPELKPLNDVISRLGAVLIGTIYNRYTVSTEKTECFSIRFALAGLKPMDFEYDCFLRYGIESSSFESTAYSIISGKSFERHLLVRSSPSIEFKTEKISFPEFSNPKELEMKLKIMGKI